MTRNREAHTTDLRAQLQATLAGAYELERELGGGGMSRVFLAHETALGRRVVVKVLSPTLAAGVSAERFRREILLVAKLQHPHIVPVHAAGESGGLPYFTMPFVEGESLRARIAREGELPIPEVVRLLRDIASALSYAHAQGVIHRDIKPDNVLLSVGSAVVADFGVAKALSEAVTEGDASHITSLGIALGTPAYMAPEQAAGDPAMDHRVDIYAFGVMAYEMLAGRPPFTGRNPQALFAAHVTEPPPPVQSLRPTVPAALAALVMRCLEKHAADRPTNADDILHALDSMSTPSGGSVPTTAFRMSRGLVVPAAAAGRKRAWLWAGIGAGTVVVAGTVIFSLRGGTAPPQETMQLVDSAPAPAPAPATAAPVPPPVAADTLSNPLRPRERAPVTAARPPVAPPAAAPDTTVMVRLRLNAMEARRTASETSGPAGRLARGDSLLARGDSLRRARRIQEAALAYSSAGTAWASVTAAAAAPPPAPVRAAEPEPERVREPEPERQPVRDPRPAVEAAVAGYARAIESRSTARIREVNPGLTAAQEQDWRQFFDAVETVQVTLRVTGVDVAGDSAEATAAGTYVFANATTRRTEQQPVTIRMSFRRGAGGEWRLSAIR